VVSKDLLSILVCPDSHQPLQLADEALLDKVNRAIRAGRLTNRGGQAVSDVLEEGLVRQDAQWLYPVVDGIPVMLVDEAIFIGQLAEPNDNPS